LFLPLIGIIVIGYVWLNLAGQAKLLGLAWLVIGLIIAGILATKKKEVDLPL